MGSRVAVSIGIGDKVSVGMSSDGIAVIRSTRVASVATLLGVNVAVGVAVEDAVAVNVVVGTLVLVSVDVGEVVCDASAPSVGDGPEGSMRSWLSNSIPALAMITATITTHRFTRLPPLYSDRFHHREARRLYMLKFEGVRKQIYGCCAQVIWSGIQAIPQPPGGVRVMSDLPDLFPVEIYTHLGNIVVALSQALSTTQTPFDRPATRILLGLYDVVLVADGQLSRFFEALDRFQKETQIGWKVYWIHRAGKGLEDLQETLSELIKWIDSRKSDLYQMQVWTADNESAWDLINDHDAGYGVGESAIETLKASIAGFRHQLQATTSPDPTQFPAQAEIVEVNTYLADLHEKIRGTRKILRDFATNHLAVSQFF